MLNQLKWSFLALNCLLASSFVSECHAAQEGTYSGVVTRVTDGDTIRFRRDGAREGEKDWTIRMVGIDSPELHLPVAGSPPVGQTPWGDRAAKAMDVLAPVGTRVQLVHFGKDAHFRVLGRVEQQGDDINLRMIERGWAVPYIICEGQACNREFFEKQHVAQYLQACEDARKQKVGIFSQRQPLQEMPFEFRLRMQGRQPDKYVGDFFSHQLYEPSRYSEVDLCRRVFFLKREAAIGLGFQPAERR